jgi:membrane protein implicated in regulation of membrane protease activity
VSSSPLSWLGVGHAPLSVLLICLLVYWAAVGSLGNLALGIRNIGFSVALALVGSLLATGATARLIKRFLPVSQSFSVARHELIGREGVAIYPITESSGTVRLYDKLGTLRQLDSRTVPGGAVIPQDTKVIVVDYNRERQVFTVQKWDDLVQTKEE